MNVPNSFGLYAILTDPVKGYEYTARLFVDYRVPFIQLRMKHAAADDVQATGEKLRAITRGSSSRLIINDYPAIAAAVGADGVHLGQEDIPYEKARGIVGPPALIGISTHSPEQTQTACKLTADYIGIGPVFATPTKEKPDPAIGIDGMQKMLGLATVPAVAIGGIDLTNLRYVLSAGARNFCMVRQLMQSANPEKELKEALKIYGEYSPQ